MYIVYLHCRIQCPLPSSPGKSLDKSLLAQVLSHMSHMPSHVVIGCNTCRSSPRPSELRVISQKGCFAQASIKVGVMCVAFAGTRYICISFTYLLRIICACFAYHLRILCISFAYHLHIICISFAHVLPIICISFAYHLHIVCKSFTYLKLIITISITDVMLLGITAKTLFYPKTGPSRSKWEQQSMC